jgi:hypothetical protein
MRNNVKMLLAAGLIAATTAACTGETGYPGSTYGYPSTAYNNGGYYQNGTYYSSRPAYSTAYNSGYYTAPSTAYSTGYYAQPTTPRRGPNGDYDRDGIPNKYDRDANGDGVPDRFQR